MFLINSVRYLDNTVKFLQNSRNRHRIARPWRRGMLRLLWVTYKLRVMFRLSRCMLDRVIAARHRSTNMSRQWPWSYDFLCLILIEISFFANEFGAWISQCISMNLWDVITHKSPTINCSYQVRTWTSNYTHHISLHLATYHCGKKT